MLGFLHRQAARLEAESLNPLAATAAFMAVVMARHVLEILAGQNPVYYPIQIYFHYTLAYVAPFLALVLVLHLFSGVELVRVARLMLYVWSLTLLPPLVDLLLGHGGKAIGYLRPERQGVSELFLRFFDPTASFAGTTPGIRVETAIACLLGAGYVVLRGRGRYQPAWLGLRAAGAFLGVYFTALGFFTLPRLFEAAMRTLAGWDLERLYALPVYTHLPAPIPLAVIDRLYMLYLVPLCLALAAVAAWRARSPALAALGRRVSPGDALAAATLTALGILLAGATRQALLGQSPAPSPIDLGLAAGLIVAGGLIPLAAAGLDETFAASRTPAMVLLAAALMLAYCAGPTSTALMLAAFLLLLACRVPPLLLESREPAAGLARAVAGLSLFGAGMGWALGQEALMLLPHGIAVGLLGGLSLAGLAGGRRVAGRGDAQQYSMLWIRFTALLWPLAAGVLALGFRTSALLALMAVSAMAAAALPRLGGAPRVGLEKLAWALVVMLVGMGSMTDPGWSADLAAETTSRPRFLIRRGMLAEEEARYTEAARHYRRAVQQQSNLPAVHARLGEILFVHLDRPDEARQAFDAALAGNPDDVASLSQLAVLLRDQGALDEALALLVRAVQLQPGSPGLWWEQAATLQEMTGRQTEEAMALRGYLEAAAGRPEEEMFIPEARSRLRQLQETPPGDARD